MNKTLEQETERIKNEIKKVSDEVDKCTLKKCKHIKNLKTQFKAFKNCQEKVKDYPPEKIMDRMKDQQTCMKKNKITNEMLIQVGNCVNDKCTDKMDKVKVLASELVYLTHPHGKELKQLQTKLVELQDQEKLCRKDKCGHIYPLDKLKADNKKCDKFLFEKGDKFNECLNKYKVYENNTKIAKCKKSKCKKIIKSLDETRAKLFKLQNPSSLKHMFRNIMSKKKSKSMK
jgi:hypothetical protein